MMTNMDQLRAVQFSGHLAIDEVAAQMAAVVYALIKRRTVITPISIPAILHSIDQLIRTVEPVLTNIVVDHAHEAARVADPVEAMRVDEIATTTLMTSLSLARARPGIVEQAGKILERGVRLGLGIPLIAKHVQQYFSPFFAPRRNAQGVMVRDTRVGAVTHWPGQAGMATQHVRMVMLAETTAGNYYGMKRQAEREDRLMRYRVSFGHSKVDECDEKAQVDNGFGPGVYTPAEAPRLPTHYRCRCAYETVSRS